MLMDTADADEDMKETYDSVLFFALTIVKRFPAICKYLDETVIVSIDNRQ